MGAFYGSTQVRSEDRDRVKAVAEDVARRLKIHMLIGPVLNGWIGIYPEGSGQDQRVGEALFQGLNTTVWHVLVHDDDILAYWLWHDGRLADSYHSNPGYFGEENRAEEEASVGNPETLSQLVGGKVADLRKLLARDDSHPLGSLQLDELQSLTGVRNLVASYEYLKEGETQGIKGRRQFVEVPGDLIQAEKQDNRQQKSTLASDRRKLKKAGLLLTIEERGQPMAVACTLSDGFLVAWPDLPRNSGTFAAHRAPWNEPTPVALDTTAHIAGVVSDPSRQRVAIATGNCVRVWDIAGGSWNLIADIPERDLAIDVAISADGKLVAHSSRDEIVVSDVASGRRLLSCPGVQSKGMAFHPSGEWLAVPGNPFGLISIGEEPHWRQLYVAGKESAAKVREYMLTAFGQTDVDAIMKATRAAMEVMIEQKRREVERAGQSAETKEIVERERARLEKQFEEESWFLRLKQDPNAQPPRKANQAVTATGFSRNGEWLWCGTDVGFRIYRWSDVPRPAGSDLLEPALGPARPFDGHVHAIAEEVDASAIVFSVHPGRVLRFELSTGETRELVQVPGHVAIFGLTMSADGKTLGLTTQATQVTGRNARKWTWQVWDYSLLRGQGSRTN